jgi:hypothetical protein
LNGLFLKNKSSKQTLKWIQGYFIFIFFFDFLIFFILFFRYKNKKNAYRDEPIDNEDDVYDVNHSKVNYVGSGGLFQDVEELEEHFNNNF